MKTSLAVDFLKNNTISYVPREISSVSAGILVNWSTVYVAYTCVN